MAMTYESGATTEEFIPADFNGYGKCHKRYKTKISSLFVDLLRDMMYKSDIQLFPVEALLSKECEFNTTVTKISRLYSMLL